MGLPKLAHRATGVFICLFPAATFGLTIVDRPLDPTGYGYTSHEGQQQMFDHFELGAGALVNQLTWYGQFSDGLAGNNQTLGEFNVFLFESDPEGETMTPEGVITTGTPSTPVMALRSQSSVGIATGIADPLQGGNIKLWGIEIPTLYLDPGKYWITICAASVEPGFYLWNHSVAVVDGVDFAGSVSASNEPRMWSSSSAPERDAMAFSLNYVSVPDGSSGLMLLSISMGALYAVNRKITRRD